MIAMHCCCLKARTILKLRFLLDLLDQEGIPYATRKMTQYGGGALRRFSRSGCRPPLQPAATARVYVTAENYEQAKELLAALEGIAVTWRRRY